MKYALLILAFIGLTASSLALREHYRTYGDAPCDINERWDCGIVNHSPYAVIDGVPVAVIGIAGYLVLGLLAWKRAYAIMLRSLSRHWLSRCTSHASSSTCSGSGACIARYR